MAKLEKQFEKLSREDILAIRPGQWSDFELLSVIQLFDEQKDWQRSAAVTELILRSPEHSETVVYEELYFEVMEYYRHTARNFPTALRWAHAAIAYLEQHEPGMNRFNRWRDLADTYLGTGDLQAGLAMYARILQADPSDIWTYNTLSMELRFAGLAALEVEVLDRALTMVRRSDPEDLSAQLQRFHDEASQKLRDGADNLERIPVAILADFRSALALADGEPQKLAGLEREGYGEIISQPYLPPVERLLALGQAEDAALFAEIAERGKVLAPELIRMAFDPNLHEAAEDEPGRFAPAHAVALLRRLRASVALDELSLWLDRADGDWYHELLVSSWGKIGGYSNAELQKSAANTDYSPDVRASAITALVERANRFPEQRDSVNAFFRELLNRSEVYELAEEETFSGFLISGILDMEGGRALYPDIQRAYEEDRVDTKIVGLADVHDEWKLKPIQQPKRRKDGLYLRLICTECGRMREHFVQYVLVDGTMIEKSKGGEEPEFSPYIMDRKITCPKCGAVDRYKLAPESYMALFEFPDVKTMTDLLMGRQPGLPPKPNPRVHYLRFDALGRPMHPFAALAEYRRRIATNPGDGKHYEGLGNILRALNRPQEALEIFQEGCEVEPNNPELAMSLAMCAHDLGDKKTAKRMYERTIELASPGGFGRLLRFGGGKREELAMIAFEGLERLRLRQSSPWALPWERDEEPEPSSSPRPARPSQPGRPKKKKRKKR